MKSQGIRQKIDGIKAAVTTRKNDRAQLGKDIRAREGDIAGARKLIAEHKKEIAASFKKDKKDAAMIRQLGRKLDAAIRLEKAVEKKAQAKAKAKAKAEAKLAKIRAKAEEKRLAKERAKAAPLPTPEPVAPAATPEIEPGERETVEVNGAGATPPQPQV